MDIIVPHPAVFDLSFVERKAYCKFFPQGGTIPAVAIRTLSAPQLHYQRTHDTESVS